jgi:hypothetical protein
MLIAFLFEAPARPLSVPAMRHLQNQCADKRLHPRPGRAGGARFYLAVLTGRDLRPTNPAANSQLMLARRVCHSHAAAANIGSLLPRR